jgi:hypothetical protein
MVFLAAGERAGSCATAATLLVAPAAHGALLCRPDTVGQDMVHPQVPGMTGVRHMSRFMSGANLMQIVFRIRI